MVFLAAAKAKWVLAFALIAGLGVAVPRWLDPGQTQLYTLDVPLADASGLYPGSDVEIAGARAGRIENLQLQGGVALATISVDAVHAPVRQDARVDVRPKSLLGEKYMALDPGRAASSLDTGARLSPASVTRSVELQDVFNTFDAPTRDKLQIVISELGGGVAGEGRVQNRGLSYGRQDLDDLSRIADTLARRDRELQDVIASLSQVTDELAQSDRRTQLGALIKNTENLMRQLADQDAQIKRALTETNAALSRTATALDGTGPNLASINRSLGTTVHLANGTTADLGSGLDVLMPHLDLFIASVREGPMVFGGRDSSGYATRINIVAGPGTLGAGAPAAGPAPALPGGGPGAAAPGALGPAIGFILGTPAGALP